jgi:hypothetical protein
MTDIVTITEPGDTVVTIQSSPEVVVVAGPPGQSGDTAWHWGHGAPTGDHGWAIGSLYLDVDSGALYEVGE